MKVATLNLGSATVKLALAETDGVEAEVTRRRTVALDPDPADGAALEDHVLEALEASRIRPGAVDAVGHRVVHGGREFTEPAVVGPEVEEAVGELVQLAPLHSPLALAGIGAARRYFPGRPMVAVFDTAFHAGRPEASRTYALPRRLTEPAGLVRYGFHGIAHAALAESAARAQGTGPGDVSAVTLQLGAGCSACAVRDGRSVETSMGATPLEGLVMPARSGDVGPGALLRMIPEAGGPERLEEVLAGGSGLKGLAGSADVRELLDREREGDGDAELALAVFVRRIVQTTGAYLTLLEGDGGVVFGGGIGSNSAEIRARVADGLRAWDVELDPGLNEGPAEGRISPPGRRPVYAFTTDEERLIARDTAGCLVREPTERTREEGRTCLS
ncbi:MAG: acetate/propionate family kinase [Gemmatimonadota bacterium]